MRRINSKAGTSTRLRRAKNLRQFIEQLEHRRLLTTLVINGTAGNDTWLVDATPGLILVNDVAQNSNGVTDIQFNGLDGNDQLNITRSTYPIVYNGGNNNDSVRLANGNLGLVTAQITFNGGAGADAATMDDSTYNQS